MKVFVTGVNGYIGAVLAPFLIERGLQVLGLDTGYYRDGWLYSDNRHLAESPHTLNKDLRHVTERDLEGCDAVAHLAELSNDPLGQNNPEVTHQINHRGSVSLAETARAAGIRRFRLHIVVQCLWRRYWRVPGRNLRHEPADRVRRVQGAGRAGRRQHCGPGFLSRVPAQRDGIRSVAAHALRHRDQRPVGTGLDHATDCDDERRQSVAAGRARRGHLRGDLSVAGRAGRMRCAARSSTSVRTRTTTGFARSRRSWPRSSRVAR